MAGVDRPAQLMVDSDFLFEDIGLKLRSEFAGPSFGLGEIIDSLVLSVTVKFDNGNIKKLNVEFARLEKI